MSIKHCKMKYKILSFLNKNELNTLKLVCSLFNCIINKSTKIKLIKYCYGCNLIKNKSKFWKCGQCKKVYYCSFKCQKYHWKILHKYKCQNAGK